MMHDLVTCLYLLKKVERHAKETADKGAQQFDANIELSTDGSGTAEVAPWWRGESYQEFHCSWDKLRDMLPTVTKAVKDYLTAPTDEDTTQ